MPNASPILYLIGGPNGSGKTTFAKEYLPNTAKCLKFLNSDEIARGLEPLAPEKGQIQAGKILLSNLKQNIKLRKTFALESTLSGKTYVKHLQQAKDKGYQIILHFLWIPSAELSLERVKQRVSEGGHHVSGIDIMRRYPRIMNNIFDTYLPLADQWHFWDASALPLKHISDSATSIANLRASLSPSNNIALEEDTPPYEPFALNQSALNSAKNLLDLKRKLDQNIVTSENDEINITPAQHYFLNR